MIYGSKSVCIEISFASPGFGEANKRTRKYRGEPQNGKKPCAADQLLSLSHFLAAYIGVMLATSVSNKEE